MGVLKPNVATGLAASLGLAQGVIWSNMALICIVMYNAHPYTVEWNTNRAKRNYPGGPDGPEGPEGLGNLDKAAAGQAGPPTGRLIWGYVIAPSSYHGAETKYSPTFNGSLFDAFVWIHFILHIIWLIVSVCILTKMGEKKRMAQVWCVITAIIFLWDFVTSCIIMDDHRRCTKEHKDAYDLTKKAITNNGQRPLNSKQQDDLDEAYYASKKPCDKAMLTVLTVTSKIFFLLWILNAFLAYELWTSYGPKIDILQH